MEQIKSLEQPSKTGITQSSTHDSDGLAYVRIDQNGKVIAVFSDESEMDVSELFTLSMMDN